MFWAASMSTTEAGFQGTMEELKCMDFNAYKHLMYKKPESWSRVFFVEGRACAAVENDISESSNSVIIEARTKPILTMLEEIRMYAMERFSRMSNKHKRWRKDVCPAILEKLDLALVDMRLWTVVASETNVFEVRLGFDAYQVDLEQKFCTCRLWAISGVPCIHACAAMNYTHHNKEDFISTYFSKEKFAETYKGNIRPLNGSKKDNGGYKRLKASGGTKICTNCWKNGDNRRTCPNLTTEQPPKLKKRMGRPRTREEPAPKTGDGSQVKRGRPRGSQNQRTTSGSRKVNERNGTITGTTSRSQTGTKGNEKVDEGVQGTQKVDEDVQGTQKVDEGVQGTQVDTGLEYFDDETWLQDVDVNDDGTVLQNVEVIPDLNGDSYVSDFLYSGYTAGEVGQAIRHITVPIPVEPLVDAAEEDQVEIPETEDDDERIAETQPSQRLRRSRKYSERIVKLQLAKKMSGPGSCSEAPLTL